MLINIISSIKKLSINIQRIQWKCINTRVKYLCACELFELYFILFLDNHKNYSYLKVTIFIISTTGEYIKHLNLKIDKMKQHKFVNLT